MNHIEHIPRSVAKGDRELQLPHGFKGSRSPPPGYWLSLLLCPIVPLKTRRRERESELRILVRMGVREEEVSGGNLGKERRVEGWTRED